VDAAKDGLMPDGKEGALVPFKGKVVYQPMVGGILKKIRNSGELSSINPQIIRSNDTFDYYIDEKGPHLMHRPNFQNPGEMTGTYTLAVMKDGGIYLEVMTKEQVDKIRARSPSGTSGPWVSDYEEMAKKTGLKRLSKRLPMSTDIESFFGQDDEVDAITEQTQAVHQVASTAETATPVQAASASAPGVVQGPSKLKSALKAKEPLPPAQEIIQTTATPILTNREDPGPMDFNDPNLPL
jgi:recombinational DNA repair protein RecT